MKKFYNTETMRVAAINKILTVELVAEILSGVRGKSALLLLAMLIWKRENEPHEWIRVTNPQWKKRTGLDRHAKYHAGKSLQEMGHVEIRTEGKQSLQFKLAPDVDPRAREAIYAAKKAAAQAGAYSSPGMEQGDMILSNLTRPPE